MAGVGVLRVNGKGAALDPFGDAFFFGGGGLRFFLRRHQPGAHIFQHAQPQVMVGREFGLGLELVEGNLALAFTVAVAVEAVFFQQRPDVSVKFRSRLSAPRHARRGNGDQGGEKWAAHAHADVAGYPAVSNVFKRCMVSRQARVT